MIRLHLKTGMPCGRLVSKAAAVLLSGLLAVLLTFCGSCHPALKNSRLGNGKPTKEALAESVLEAIARNDLQAMKDLSLSKEEFLTCVWPELPASNPKTNLTVDFVWSDVYFRSMSRMQGIFAELKDKHFRLVSVIHRGKLAEYATHRAYPRMEVVLRDDAGREAPYPLFGTLIEMDGRFKVYSYAPVD